MQLSYSTSTTPDRQIPDTISTLAEIPETLYAQIQKFLENNTEFDHHKLFEASIALFLAEHATETTDRALASRHYLNTLFFGKGEA